MGSLSRCYLHLMTYKIPCLVQLPSSSKWGQQTVITINHNQNTLSLAEIQKLEEERERQAREEVRKQSFPSRKSHMQSFSHSHHLMPIFREWVLNSFLFLSWQHRRQQQELLKLQQQQALQLSQQPQAKPSGWGSMAKQPAVTKSLLEIQREEAQQMKQRKEQQPQHPTVTQPTRTQARTVGLGDKW